VVQISWQIIGILPKRKWILAQVCLEAQHCEGFAEIRSGTCGGVKGLMESQLIFINYKNSWEESMM